MSNDLELTVLLQRAGVDPSAGEALLPRVYEELRRLANGQMGREARGQTLQATALVHEAWIKLVGQHGEALSWDSRGHFFGAAAQAMRRILVDRARRNQAEKHGGAMRRQPLDMADQALNLEEINFLALDGALTALQGHDPNAAKVVELRFFGGLSVADTALATGVSERTVAREWNVAKAWLARALSDTEE